jgi:hypothetical protein
MCKLELQATCNQIQVRSLHYQHSLQHRVTADGLLLCIAALDAQEMQPLPYQQLTHLELVSGHFTASNVQAMISGLLQLETLEVIDAEEAFDLLAVDAVALSKLPKLRLVNLSGSVLWDGGPTDQPVQGDAKLSYLPLPVVHHLVCLQRAVPTIEWELGHDQHWPPSSPALAVWQ